MNISAPITIYNASAGSGKTYTLVELYLQKLLSTPNATNYKHYLAITFTNKAVAEMKQRIIDTLVLFSEEKSLTAPPKMLQKISEETKIPISVLHANAKNSLKHVLHNYAQLSIETIDHFNHRLIRTFARDLKLPAHFEVQLDVKQLINEAVDSLIGKAGENKETTDTLVQFALQKTDDDKSWDIGYDISNTASLLLNENDAVHLHNFKDKTLSDFQKLKETLQNKRGDILVKLQTIAATTLQTISEAGLEKTDFNGGSRAYFPNYLEKLAAKNLTVSYGNSWQETMGSKPMYPKKTTDFIAQTIDALTPNFIAAFEQSKELVASIWLYDNILKNITPLSVLHLVQQELEALKIEQNILPITEFNSLINDEIKDQPAPFIYERLGDRYQHFFIDEFQDTSLLQWQNLVPLIDNAISQEFNSTPGSVLLVGDAKQAIYRWRGGLPEQFMDLYNKKSLPFSNNHISIKNLQTNWRSTEEIIAFNNSFFTFLSGLFGNEIHQHLYKIGNQQATNTKPDGYVHLEFIPTENNDDIPTQYGMRVLATIKELIQNTKYQANDICILTRTKKDGIAVSTYLLSEGVPVISSETLLLQHSSVVQAIVNSLTIALYPEKNTVKVQLLEFLYDHFKIASSKHDFIKKCLNTNQESFSTSLLAFGIDFNLSEILQKPLYQACEYVLQQFLLDTLADAYLFAFMDLVLDFQQQPKAGKIHFLEYWEAKKETSSVPANNALNAVRVMTIHKSKGLEFPVVIYPYANTKLYAEKQAKAWFPIENASFTESLINFSAEVAHYGTIGEQLYQHRRDTLQLDNINLLYVTMTRAVEQLYIFSEVPSKIKQNNPDDFKQLFISYLSEIGMWNQDQMVYTFGNMQKTMLLPSEDTKKEEVNLIVPNYTISSPEDHQLYVARTEASLWQTEAEIAIDIGNLLHDTMEHIYTKRDIDTVLELYRSRQIHNDTIISTLEIIITKIINHPTIAHLYSDELSRETIYNERDIITSQQQLIRPDRINFFENNKVTIVDYKTGAFNAAHHTQLQLYAQILSDMGYLVTASYLIYSHGTEISINKM